MVATVVQNTLADFLPTRRAYRCLAVIVYADLHECPIGGGYCERHVLPRVGLRSYFLPIHLDTLGSAYGGREGGLKAIGDIANCDDCHD